MIGFLQPTADYLRRTFGFAKGKASDPQRDVSSGSSGSFLRKKRAKVAIAAIVFGLVSSAIELPLPAEDMLRATRAHLRSRAAPQDIVFVTVDDPTYVHYGSQPPSRAVDAQVIDRLAAAGATRIAFDRGHSDVQTPAIDALFARTLARHQGMLALGVVPEHTFGMQRIAEIIPRPEFRRHADLAAMNGLHGPFGLSVKFKTDVDLRGNKVPSISALLAGYRGPHREYRPDYAFDVSTIPTYNYLDVLAGEVPANAFAGKQVLIGESFTGSIDLFRLPMKDGKVAGAYFHIMGAHTLKRGVPLDLMWVPALLIAGAAIVTVAATRSRSTRLLVWTGAGLLAAPFLLDELNINIDVLSGVFALMWAGVGFGRINRRYFSGDVDAMTASALATDSIDPQRDIYALKIASLAEMSEDWSSREFGDFVNTLITYIKGPGDAGDVAFERDMLVWLAPRMEGAALERHADGLALMLKTAISYDWQSASSAPALGIDTNHALPTSQRIKKAMQAADEAALRGARFIINDAAYLEARNHRLELVRVLEKGLRDRSIGVAYQPKVDLKSGRVVGAETLIRWRPDDLDYVNPQELVLAAEAGDRINELTLVVMEKALVDGKRAIAVDPRFRLAVNMSAKSLSDTHLLFDIMTMLGRYGFPPENLTLELTETAKLEDQQIAPQIAALKQRGISLSIDDFGTGQSNLEYIEKLPSSELKIDKRFVQHMTESDESRAVVRATIEIAHSLGKLVVAEGVEDAATAAALCELGCDQAQGYLYARAIPITELLDLMEDPKRRVYT